MQYLKQSTASQSVLLGPFVDDTDGKTAETALTIANTDIRLSANGGNMAAKTSGGGTHDENGWYTITLDATDTATVGRLQVSCVVAGALPVFAEFQVLEEAIYDALFAASATGALPATLVQGGINTTSGTITTLDGLDTAQDTQHSTTQSALATVDGIVDAILLDTDAILTDTATTLPGLIATAQTDLDTITGTDGVTLATAQGLYAPAKAGDQMDLVSVPNATAVTAIQSGLSTAAALATVDGVVDAILVDTAEIGAAGAGLTAIPWNASWDAEVQSEVADGLAAFWTSPATLVDLVWDEPQAGHVTASTFGLYLDAAVSSASAPTAAAVADAVWEEAIADHSGTAGSTAESLNAAGGAGDPWVTALPGSYTGTQAGKILADVLADTGELQTNQGSWLTATGFSTHDAAAVADAVWDEVITGAAHNVSASAARFLRESATATTGVTGTLQSATGTTAVLESGAVPVDDYFNGERLSIIEGTGSGQSRLISDSTALTDTVTLGHAWTTTPDATSIYAIMGAEADVRAIAEQPVVATASVDFDDLATILVGTGTTIPALIGTPAADLSADIAAVKSDTGTILGRVTATVATLWSNLTAMISGSGVTAAYTATAMENVSATVSGNVTVGSLTQAALAQFAADDTGQVTAAAGSVALLSQGGGGGTVTVDAISPSLLAQLADSLENLATRDFSRRRATDWTFNTLIGDIGSTWTVILFTLKTSPTEDTDAEALIQIQLTNGGDAGDGLITLNGETHATPADGSLEITGVGSDELTVSILAQATALITPTDKLYWWQSDSVTRSMKTWVRNPDDLTEVPPVYQWDVKILNGSGSAETIPDAGTLIVSEVVTRTVE